MERQVPLDADVHADAHADARADDHSEAHADAPDETRDDRTHEIASDLAYRRLVFANAMLFGARGAGDRRWVLVDSGPAGGEDAIVAAAAERFGEGARPAAIVLTHGHFDHAGSLDELARRWSVPVYAHELELPFLAGRAVYPPADPAGAGGAGGALSRLSPPMSSGAVDVSPWLHALPDDGSIPGMPGWRWMHTPGHTPGHVCFWRSSDRTLIAGDAFITTTPESAYAAVPQRAEMHGPPPFLTQQWEQARGSVDRLAILEPELVVTGHGPAMRGAAMRAALHALSRDFDRVAMPERGRWMREEGARG